MTEKIGKIGKIEGIVDSDNTQRFDDDALHFDAAINPYGCSPRVVEAIEEFARTRVYRFYGEPTAAVLRERWAARFDLAPDNFVVYNGAGEALAWLFITHLVMRKGRLIAPSPSYERFIEAGRRVGAEVIEVPLEADSFALPVERIIKAARENRATLGLISNPNNPTGNILLSREHLDRLLNEVPECLWIVDEAYADYAGITFAPLVREHKNLVVLRTFSKAYGLAGLRVGAAIAHRSVAAPLAALRIPWCVNSLSLVAACAALEDHAYLEETVARIRHDCAEFGERLSEISYLKIYPSAANFFLLQLTVLNDEQRLKQRLIEDNMRVRSRPDMPGYIRVTSLLPQDNRRFLAVLREFEAHGEKV